MKNIYNLMLFLTATIGVAQIPAGYYNTATGTGYVLKTQLYNIINDHNDPGYGGLYTTYYTSDRDFYYENNGTLLDMYSENPFGSECEFTYGVNQDDGTLGNNECERYNREHLIPQSVFGSATPMQSDAHCVVPSDKHVNAVRGDSPFGRVGSATYTSINGSKKGNNLNSGYSAGYSGIVFEPIDEFKGDIARMYFYFATRYQNLVAGYSYPMFNNTGNQVFTSNAINILLTWANNDPVTQREIDRNNAVHDRQYNRNPFIDNPQYAMNIWGSLLSSDEFNVLDVTTIYPNPTNDNTINIQSDSNIENINIVSVNGQLVQNIKNPLAVNQIYTVTNLPSGFYFMTITSNDTTVTKKIVVN